MGHAMRALARPFARWNPYSTPNPRIFLASSATPPDAYWAAVNVASGVIEPLARSLVVHELAAGPLDGPRHRVLDIGLGTLQGLDGCGGVRIEAGQVA